MIENGSDEMVLRKADVKDIDELLKIRLAYLNEDFELTKEQIDKLKEQLPSYYKEHLEKDMFAYIAEENGVVVSSVFLIIIERPANPVFITGKIGNILNVYTEPEYRRQGIAAKLLSLAMEEGKTLDLSFLELVATQKGYPLYKKLGFEDAIAHNKPMKFIYQ